MHGGYQGNGEVEDILLNIAGMLAPVVALVPTPYRTGCRSAPSLPGETSANVANNMLAILIAGSIAWGVTVAFSWSEIRSRPLGIRTVGLIITAALLGVAWLKFEQERALFINTAHYWAAIPMFVFIVGVVGWNGWEYGRGPTGSLVNRYSSVAGAMVVSTAGLLVAGHQWDWQHTTLLVEGALIVLFAMFWAIQTHELWNVVQRPDAERTT